VRGGRKEKKQGQTAEGKGEKEVKAAQLQEASQQKHHSIELLSQRTWQKLQDQA